MKHFGREFSELLFKSGLTQKSVGDKLGLSHVTITRWKEQATIDASMLEKTCRIFHIPVTYFFDDDVVVDVPSGKIENSSSNEIELLRSQNEMLQKLLDEKERTIQLLLKH